MAPRVATEPCWHVDYMDEVGTTAFTLMTPLHDYRNRESFQLLYVDDAGRSARYEYRRGRAVCFGARFMHSTEP